MTTTTAKLDQVTVGHSLMLNQSAEAAVLGSMILDSRQIPVVLKHLDADAFGFPEHRAIFEAVLSVWRENPGADVDGILVRSRLESSRELESAGGLDYLKRVVESVASAASAEYYAKEVAERARYRAAVLAVEEMRERLAEGGPVDEIVADIQGKALGLQCQARVQNVFRTADHADNFAVETQDEPQIVPTGLRRVDDLMGGVCPGELAYVAARPSIGKTAFACCWALNMAKAGGYVVFYTLEMTARQLMERLAAMEGQVSLSIVKRRKASQDELNAFYGGALAVKKLPITIVENIPTVEGMTAVLRQLKQAGPVDLVILDYIGLMSATDSYRRNRNEQLSEISRGLKRMAQAEHVPIVALSQLNRECEGRDNHRPRMSDLRDSGSLEQDADAVLLLHREDYYRKLKDPATKDLDGLAEVLVAKARNGPTGLSQLVFIEEQMQFADLSHVDDEGVQP